ncbi:hypothetical protein [Fibrella aquatilis]|uniref:Lipoprotein n=1 Tax=Fibrella aquatilis TaxID=2817059 RepID=A0A939K0M2_9BACT|nr:hypothetical protein [Fibrella aquatilis]MBO0932156.1 hypothetical protein [Fibrella aquatilis]
MLRYLTFACLLLAISCNQDKKAEQSAVKSDTSNVATIEQHPEWYIIKIGQGDNSKLINLDDALLCYTDHKQKALKSDAFCTNRSIKFLKFGLIKEGELRIHLGIEDSSLVKFAKPTKKFNGIRFYPCIYEGNRCFLFVFTELAKRENICKKDIMESYDDMKGQPIVLLKTDISERICHIDLNKLSSHRLCVPNCPEDEKLLFDY